LFKASAGTFFLLFFNFGSSRAESQFMLLPDSFCERGGFARAAAIAQDGPAMAVPGCPQAFADWFVPPDRAPDL
jgi:hypothetical protein